MFRTRLSTAQAPAGWPKGKNDLSKRFTQAKEIGEGGFGRVFRVTDTWLGSDLAIKISEADDKLVTEVNRLRALPKEYFVQVFDYGRLASLSYFTMELLHRSDGWHSFSDFGSVMDESGIGPNERILIALLLTQNVCHGLTFLHNSRQGKLGYFHGDIKPANMFFNINSIEAWKNETPEVDQPIVKIVDLGVSGVVGKPADGWTETWAAPEQEAGKKCTELVDALPAREITSGNGAWDYSEFRVYRRQPKKEN